MRTMHALIGAVLMAVAPVSLAAGTATGYVWKGGEDTLGIGAKGWLGLGDLAFVSARLQAGKIGNPFAGVPGAPDDLDYNEARAGGGIGFVLGKGAAVFAGAQALRIDVEDLDDVGFGLFAGAAFSPADKLSLTFDVGIVDGGDFGEASEFSLGAAYALSKALSFSFARNEALVTGAVTELGVRFNF